MIILFLSIFCSDQNNAPPQLPAFTNPTAVAPPTGPYYKPIRPSDSMSLGRGGHVRQPPNNAFDFKQEILIAALREFYPEIFPVVQNAGLFSQMHLDNNNLPYCQLEKDWFSEVLEYHAKKDWNHLHMNVTKIIEWAASIAALAFSLLMKEQAADITSILAYGFCTMFSTFVSTYGAPTYVRHCERLCENDKRISDAMFFVIRAFMNPEIMGKNSTSMTQGGVLDLPESMFILAALKERIANNPETISKMWKHEAITFDKHEGIHIKLQSEKKTALKNLLDSECSSWRAWESRASCSAKISGVSAAVLECITASLKIDSKDAKNDDVSSSALAMGIMSNVVLGLSCLSTILSIYAKLSAKKLDILLKDLEEVSKQLVADQFPSTIGTVSVEQPVTQKQALELLRQNNPTAFDALKASGLIQRDGDSYRFRDGWLLETARYHIANKWNNRLAYAALGSSAATGVLALIFSSLMQWKAGEDIPSIGAYWFCTLLCIATSVYIAPTHAKYRARLCLENDSVVRAMLSPLDNDGNPIPTDLVRLVKKSPVTVERMSRAGAISPDETAASIALRHEECNPFITSLIKQSRFYETAYFWAQIFEGVFTGLAIFLAFTNTAFQTINTAIDGKDDRVSTAAAILGITNTLMQAILSFNKIICEILKIFIENLLSWLKDATNVIETIDKRDGVMRGMTGDPTSNRRGSASTAYGFSGWGESTVFPATTAAPAPPAPPAPAARLPVEADIDRFMDPRSESDIGLNNWNDAELKEARMYINTKHSGNEKYQELLVRINSRIVQLQRSGAGVTGTNAASQPAHAGDNMPFPEAGTGTKKK